LGVKNRQAQAGSLSRPFKKADRNKEEEEINTSQRRRGRSRQSRRDFCSSTVVVSRSFSRGRRRRREHIRRKMIIDAGNGPHRRENKIISHSFCKSAKARIKRDLYYISSLRSASANDWWYSLCSQT